MSNGDYLVDTNILVYYLDGEIPDTETLIDDVFRESFVVSVISKIEFLGWSEYAARPDELETARDFIDLAHVVPLTETIVEQVIRLRRHYNTRLPDCVIAATALERDATLVTRNVDDFQEMPVSLYNPFTGNE